MSKGNFFLPLYYQRLLTSTNGWKDDEFGAYVRLLIHQFENGFIPSEMDRITIIAPSARKNWGRLSPKFLDIGEGKLVNEFMESVREIQNKKSWANTENGKLGGRPRKRTESETITESETEKKPNGFENQNPEGNRNQNPNHNRTETNTILDNGSNSLEGFKGNLSYPRVPILQQMLNEWKVVNPNYPVETATDLQSLFEIGEFLANQLKTLWLPAGVQEENEIFEKWQQLALWIRADDFYKNLSLGTLSKTKTLQTIWLKCSPGKSDTPSEGLGKRFKTL